VQTNFEAWLVPAKRRVSCLAWFQTAGAGSRGLIIGQLRSRRSP